MASSNVKIVDSRLINPDGDGFAVDPSAVSGGFPVSVTTAGNYTVSSTTYGGRDPAITPVNVYVTNAATIFLPSDASKVPGARIRIFKVGAASFSVSIDPAGAPLTQNAQGSTSTAVISTGTTSFEYSVEWLWSGTAWVTDFYPRKVRMGYAVATREPWVLTPLQSRQWHRGTARA